MRKPSPPLLGPGLVSRRIEVRPRDVVLVRGHLEASEGLGLLFAERGGELVLATTLAQQAALDRFIDDLAAEMPVWGRTVAGPAASPAAEAPNRAMTDTGEEPALRGEGPRRGT